VVLSIQAEPVGLGCPVEARHQGWKVRQPAKRLLLPGFGALCPLGPGRKAPRRRRREAWPGI